MALLFADSFDHYSAAQIPRKWGSTGANVSFQSGLGRHGSACARMANLNSGILYKDLPGTYTTLIVGCAVRIPSFASVSTAPFLRMQEGTGVTTHMHLLVNPAGTIGIARGDLTTLATSTSVLLANTWYYIEWKVTVDDTVGYAELRVDGMTWATYTGDTRNGSSGTLHRVNVGNNGGSVPNLDLDDLVILDTSGTVNNDFLGDVRVDATLPDSPGTYTEWAPSGSGNYDMVNESPPNDDTDYNHSLTVGHRDSYNFPTIAPSSGLVKAVLVQVTAKKDDVGSRAIQSLVRSGGGDYVGAVQGLIEGYQMYTDVLPQNPATSAAWTLAGVNAAEFGVKVVS